MFHLIPVILEITDSELVLRIFLNLEEIENGNLIWDVIIHMVFASSALRMVMVDRLTLKH